MWKKKLLNDKLQMYPSSLRKYRNHISSLMFGDRYTVQGNSPILIFRWYGYLLKKHFRVSSWNTSCDQDKNGIRQTKRTLIPRWEDACLRIKEENCIIITIYIKPYTNLLSPSYPINPANAAPQHPVSDEPIYNAFWQHLSGID